MNKFCTNCGKKIQDNSSFCINCGNKLDSIDNDLYNVQANLTNNNDNWMKTATLIIGIISIILSFALSVLIIPVSIVGLIFGIVYTCKHKKFCAGIVLNSIGIFLAIIVTLLISSFFNYIYDNATEEIIGLSQDNETNNYYSDYYDEDYYGEEEDDYDYDYDYSSDNYYNDDVYEDNNYEDSESTAGINVSYFNAIGIDDLSDKIENRESFVLLISQTTCSHCINYKPKLESVANDYKVQVYYIEYNTLDEDQKQIFKSYLDFYATPTTVFFENGVENTNSFRIEGDSSKEKIINIFKSNGFIK